MSFDIFFMSYDEPEAESNFLELKKRFPHAKRVHGVNGIARAWKKAADLSETSHFFTMDADSRLNEGFNFQLENFKGEDDKQVHVYRCRNKVNGLVYGYGSVHLFNTQLVRNFKNVDVVDFTLSVATEGFQIQNEVASTTCFNTSPYISWKSGFREASKLASETNAYVGTTPDHRTRGRLLVWTSIGMDEQYGDLVILGARMGALHGLEFSQNPEKLALISDHEWFRNEFESNIVNRDLSIALKETREKLNALGVPCVDYDADQSRHLKQTMYHI